MSEPIPTSSAEPSAASAEARFLAFVRGGGVALLESLLREHADRAYTQARRLLGSDSSADAEDAVQEAFIQLVRTARGYDGTVPFAAWLGRLVHVSALAVRRTSTRRRRREQKVVPMHDRVPIDPDTTEQVRKMVAELPESFRAVIDLHYFAGLGQRETAQALGISVDACAMRLSRGRERLRRMLPSGETALSIAAVGDALATAPAHLAPTGVSAGIAHLSTLAAAGAVPASLITSGGWSMPVIIAALAATVIGAGSYAMHNHVLSDAPPSAQQQEPLPVVAPAEDPAATVDHVFLDHPAVGKPVFSYDGGALALGHPGNKEAKETVSVHRVVNLFTGSGVENASMMWVPTPLAIDHVHPATEGPGSLNGRLMLWVGASLTVDHSGRLIGEVATNSWRGYWLIRSDAASTKDTKVIAPVRYDLNDVHSPPLPSSPDGIPFLSAIGNGFLWPVLSEPHDDGTALLHIRYIPQTMHGRELINRIHPEGARWRHGPPPDAPEAGGTNPDLFATLEDGSLARIHNLDGSTTTIIDRIAIERAAGNPIERVELVAEGVDGSLLVAGVRTNPQEAHTKGTWVPSGDEAPKHGLNPGSAEPGPSMPRHLFMWHSSGTCKRVDTVSVARWCDARLVLPSPGLAHYLTVHLAHDASDHDRAEVWLGQYEVVVGSSGQDARPEISVGNPFGRSRTPIQLLPIAGAADGKKALLLAARLDRHLSFSFWVTDGERLTRVGAEIDAERGDGFDGERALAVTLTGGMVAVNLEQVSPFGFGNDTPVGTILLRIPKW